MWKLNNTLLDNQGPKKKSKGKLENIFRQIIIKIQHLKTYRMQQNNSKKEVYSDKCPY